MTDREKLIEAMARAMAEAHIRIVRRWDTSPAKIEETMPRAVDACWKDFSEAATAALSAIEAMGATVVPVEATNTDKKKQFRIGDRVTKIKGSQWTGRIVGFYSTTLTPEGYAVESETEIGSVQIYPAAAIRALKDTP
jgi:dihydrofolate reductase (trimethoprim resistance protein)